MSQDSSPLAALQALVWRAMERLPAGADALMRGARGLADAALSRPLPLRLLAGETGSGAGRLVLAGQGGSLDYFAHRFFASKASDTPDGTIDRGSIPKHLPEADLALCRLGRRAAARLEGRGVLLVPEAVGARLAVAPDGSSFAGANATARRNIRQVEKRGYTWTASHDPAAFEHFYDAMYVPFAKARYGELSFVRRREALRRRFRQGGLLEVRQEGRLVAAQVFQIMGQTIEMLGPGTPGGDPEPVRQGAFSALYIFAEAYARQQGLAWLDFGGSLPTLSDGVLKHKRGWGASIADRVEADHDIALYWKAASQPLLAFLRAHPLVVRDGHGLALLAVEGHAEPLPPGLNRILTVRAGASSGDLIH